MPLGPGGCGSARRGSEPTSGSPEACAISMGPPIQALDFGSLLHKAPSTSDGPFLPFSFLLLRASNLVPIPDLLCPWVISLAFLGAAHPKPPTFASSPHSLLSCSPPHLACHLANGLFPSQ